MRERITEARLRSLAEAAAGENVTGTLYEPDSEDVLGLVAEVRRLRGLIVALNTAAIGYDRDYYSCDACDEDIGKPHKSNCPLGAIETEAGAIEAETAAPSESPEPQPVPLVDVGVCLRPASRTAGIDVTPPAADKAKEYRCADCGQTRLADFPTAC